MTAKLDIDEVIHDIPVEYRDRYQSLLDQAPVSSDALRQQLDLYITTVRKVGPLVAFIDVDEAELMAAACVAIIHMIDGADSADLHKVVQATVHYFILEEEDEEVTGVLGFDDDIQVLNAALRALGRNDLVIPLHRPE
jgi:hypothetical protein